MPQSADKSRRSAVIIIMLGVITIGLLANTPAVLAQLTVTDGLQFWVKADAGITMGATGVSVWADQSGNGRNATAETLNQPEFVSFEPGINNQPLLFFDGNLDLMTIDQRILPDSNAETTMFAVARADQPDNPSIFSMREGNNLVQLDTQGGLGPPDLGKARFIVRNTNGATANSLGDFAFPEGGGDPFYGIYAGRLTASGTQGTAQVYFNGAQGQGSAVTLDFGAESAFFSGEQQIGGVNCCNQLNWMGDIAEILVYDQALSIPDLNSVGDYLQQKYGVTWAPIAEPPPDPDIQTWNVDQSANWNSASNWINDCDPMLGCNSTVVPDKATAEDQDDQTAVFGDAITQPRVVFTETQVTVESVQFLHGVSYTIAGAAGGGVNLQSDSGTATLQAAAGDHDFQAVVNLNNNTNAEISSGASLSFNNALNLNGNTLAKMGGGTLNVNNRLNTGAGGAIDCNEGVCGGNGTISGNFNNSGGTVSPGNSPGALEVDGDYSQGAEGTLLIEIAGTESGVTHDLFQVTGTAELAGTLEVALLDGFQPTAGDTFDILNVVTFVGGFDDLTLPALSGGLVWDDAALYAEGRLAVVPEPCSLALLLVGSLLLAGRRRNWGK